MIFLWRVGLIDTYNFVQFCINGEIQYGVIVSTAVAGNFSNIKPSTLLEPILGLGVSYRFILNAKI